MANVSQRGFWPKKSIHGSSTFDVTRGYIASAYATAIFIADPVTLDATNTVIIGTTSGFLVGISNGGSYVSGGKRQASKYVPASTTYAPTAAGSVNASYIYYFSDPGQEFEAEGDAALTSDYYKYVNENTDSITGGGGSTTTGISNAALSISGLGTSTKQWRIKRLVDRADNDVSLTAAKMIVQYNVATAGGNPYLTATGV